MPTTTDRCSCPLVPPAALISKLAWKLSKAPPGRSGALAVLRDDEGMVWGAYLSQDGLRVVSAPGRGPTVQELAEAAPVTVEVLPATIRQQLHEALALRDLRLGLSLSAVSLPMAVA